MRSMCRVKKIFVIMMFVVFVCCGISGCTAYQEYLRQQNSEVTMSYALPQFSALSVNGNSFVELVDGVPAVCYRVQRKNLSDIHIVVKNNTLYINNALSLPVLVKVHAKNMKFIKVTENANVLSTKIITNGAHISVSGDASLALDGLLNVAKITHTGRGKVELHWINSRCLDIESNALGSLYMSGTVDHLVAKLSGLAFLDARYLRAQLTSVFVTNMAHADVVALQTLNAYADDKASVFYYKNPQKLNKVTRDSGNVFLYEELQ